VFILRHFCQDWLADLLRFFLSIFYIVRFLYACCTLALRAFQEDMSPKLWSWKIIALSSGMYFISENIYYPSGRDGLLYGAFTSKYLRAERTKFFFFFIHVMPVAYYGIHGKTERCAWSPWERSSSSASASWPLLSHGIALPSARTRNRRGKYFRFQHLLLRPVFFTLSFPLFRSFSAWCCRYKCIRGYA